MASNNDIAKSINAPHLIREVPIGERFNTGISFNYPETEADAPDQRGITRMALLRQVSQALDEKDWTSITIIITKSR